MATLTASSMTVDSLCPDHEPFIGVSLGGDAGGPSPFRTHIFTLHYSLLFSLR